MEEKLKKLNVAEGQYKIISNYFNKNEFVEESNQVIYGLINDIAGKNIMQKIKSDGLDKMHLYFSVDYVPFLEAALKKKFNETMYKQIFYVGKNNLFLNKKNVFYIDKGINYRIIYPFRVSVKSRLKRKVYRLLNLENFLNPETEILNAQKNKNKYKLTKADINKLRYFKNLPDPSCGHGPHRDTWFGHTFDALNLWWSIAGVNTKTGMTIYPDVNNHELDHIFDPSYVLPNQYLGKPKTIGLKDGNLLIFDPEILHATKLNTSNQTRIVFSGRINRIKPSFYNRKGAPEFAHWLLSEDVEKDQFNKTHYFFRKDNSIVKPKRKKLNKTKWLEIKINKQFKNQSKFKLIKKTALNKKKFYKIKFKNVTLCMFFLKNDVRIFNIKCPHLQADLSDGYFNKNHVICPGHQLTFNLRNGKSTCNNFKIKLYKVKIENNYLFLYT